MALANMPLTPPESNQEDKKVVEFDRDNVNIEQAMQVLPEEQRKLLLAQVALHKSMFEQDPVMKDILEGRHRQHPSEQ